MRFRQGLLSVVALMVLSCSLFGCSKSDTGADAPPGANDAKQSPRKAPPGKPMLSPGSSGGTTTPGKPGAASPD